MEEIYFPLCSGTEGMNIVLLSSLCHPPLSSLKGGNLPPSLSVLKSRLFLPSILVRQHVEGEPEEDDEQPA
jgi:hypothetical protein